ncbi:MAG: hypothetical protein L6U99_12720 [Clostridium sp.]|nr:MAG: hypothetical protein L6U99_12720 [Clostridium sp.]
MELSQILSRLFDLLIILAKKEVNLTSRDISYAIEVVLNNLEEEFIELWNNRKALCYTYNNKPIYPKNN